MEVCFIKSKIILASIFTVVLGVSSFILLWTDAFNEKTNLKMTTATNSDVDSINYDDYLLKMGTPIDLINKLSQETKIDIVNQDIAQNGEGVFGGSTLTDTSINDTTEDSLQKAYPKQWYKHENLISQSEYNKGSISTSDLELIMTHYNYPSHISVFLEYKWLNEDEPFNRYQDPIGVAWDDNVFSYKTDTFIREDCAETSTGSIYSRTDTALADVTPYGLGWHADLIGPASAYKSIFGYANFQLEKLKSSGSSTLYCEYTHAKTLDILSISVLGSSNYDFQTSSYTVSY